MAFLRNNPDVGERHGEMAGLVRNPFKTKFMRGNFDAMIETYDTRHRNLINPAGIRCVGNSWATHFWRGFDGVKLDYSGMKDSGAYACYRAGQEVRRVLGR